MKLSQPTGPPRGGKAQPSLRSDHDPGASRRRQEAVRVARKALEVYAVLSGHLSPSAVMLACGARGGEAGEAPRWVSADPGPAIVWAGGPHTQPCAPPAVGRCPRSLTCLRMSAAPLAHTQSSVLMVSPQPHHPWVSKLSHPGRAEARGMLLCGFACLVCKGVGSPAGASWLSNSLRRVLSCFSSKMSGLDLIVSKGPSSLYVS